MSAARIIELRGQRAVMADLLDEAAAVLATIDPESTDEAQRVSLLLDSIQDAVRLVRMDGLDIDAIYSRRK